MGGKRIKQAGRVMRSAVCRFLAEYEAAHKAFVPLSNTAHTAYENAFSYLAGLTLDNKGLTPGEAKELLQLFDEYERASGDALDAECSLSDAVRRLETAWNSPGKLANKR